MKKNVFFVIFYALAFVSVVVNMVFIIKETVAPDIDSLPKGTLIVSVENPEKDMVFNVYSVENSLGCAIRGEVVKKGKAENVYWQTGIEKVNCGWYSKKVVKINSVFLDVVRGDKFDCRKDVSIFQSSGLTAEQIESENTKPY